MKRAFLLLLLPICTVSVYADSLWRDKITASDPAADQLFGWSVSVDSDNVLIGAIRQNNYTGAAYTFRPCPVADLTGDCFVDIEDFAVIAGEWLRGEDL